MAMPDIGWALAWLGLEFWLTSLAHHSFRRHESKEMSTLLTLLVLYPTSMVLCLGMVLHPMWLTSIVAFPVYYGLLGLRIVNYRLSTSHPLALYPGPTVCKITKLWMVYVASQGKLHLYMKQLHDKYGPIVRTGPNELSIVDVELVPYIMGKEGMPKGPLWDGRRISGSRGAGAKNTKGHLIGAHDMKIHAESRKVWNRAFTPAAVKGYEPIVIRRAAQLVEELKTRCDHGNCAEVDLSLWLSYFAFDFMGDMVFGGGFELMHDGDTSGMYRTMAAGLYLPSLTQQIPWVAPALPYVPFIARHMKALGQFSFKRITRRLQEGSVQNDLFYHLLDASPDGKQTPFPVIMTNAVTAVIAGSDTTAVTLSNIFYCILAHPESYKKLQQEVDAAFPGRSEPTDAATLAGLPYMNAVVNETLRLYPPVPTSLQRSPTPGSGSHRIGPKMVVLEGTAILVPPYVMHRDPRYFSPDPNLFWPERWLSSEDPAVTLNMGAFMPFSVGPMNCVGRPVALLTLRMVLAYLVQCFDMSLVGGYDPGQWEEDMRDHFTSQKGALPATVTPRF